MRSLLEPIHDLLIIFSAESLKKRSLLLKYDQLTLIKSCNYLFHKLKEVTDYLIVDLKVFKPQEKFK